MKKLLLISIFLVLLGASPLLFIHPQKKQLTTPQICMILADIAAQAYVYGYEQGNCARLLLLLNRQTEKIAVPRELRKEVLKFTTGYCRLGQIHYEQHIQKDVHGLWTDLYQKCKTVKEAL